MNFPIPIEVLYAGLAGTVLALIIATAQQKWSCRVFFLLALRLAIGWQFLFEGLYKINSHYAGPGAEATARKFTSEPYFRAAPGPIGAYMRRQFDDPLKTIAEKVKPTKEITPQAFAKLSETEQAEACPESVAKELAAMEEQAEALLKAEGEADIKAATAAEERAIKDIDDKEQRALKGDWTPDAITLIRSTADEERNKARNLAEGRRQQILARIASYQQIGQDLITAVKAQPNGGMLTGPLETVLKTMKAKTEDELKTVSTDEQKAIDKATATELRTLKGELTEAEKAQFRSIAESARKAAKEKADKARDAARQTIASAKELVPKRILAAKAEYARWVYGVDRRAAKVKFVAGDVSLTAPERLEHLDWLRKEVKAADEQHAAGLGNGFGTDQKRTAELRTDLIAAETDLANDATAFVAELKDSNGGVLTKDLISEDETKRIAAEKRVDDLVGKDVRQKFQDEMKKDAKPTRPGDTLDKITMWFLVGVGACLMGGLLTRLACLLAAGFLVMTYLAFPPFPWYPVAPNTEGNPLFINKNAIEVIALMALACMPTGRWLGLDALVLRPFCRRKSEAATT